MNNRLTQLFSKKKEQPDLFSVDSPAQIDLMKAELRAIADLLK